MSEQPDRELREVLDVARPPRAREAFKAELAERFLSGRFEQPARIERDLEAWRVPNARPEFREQLRQRFVASEAAEPELAPVHSFTRYLLAAVAAAAVVLIWAAPWGSSPTNSWRPVSYELAEVTPVVDIDGRSVPFSDHETLDRSLTGGCRLETSSEPLFVMNLEEGVLLEFAEATRIDVRRGASASGGPALSFEVLTGGLYLSTRPEFSGVIQVRTPDALIELTGRSLGIDVYDSGTCLCILEGEATIQAVDSGGERRVLSNSTAFYYRDGSESVLMEGEVHHSEPLEAVLAVGEAQLY